MKLLLIICLMSLSLLQAKDKVIHGTMERTSKTDRVQIFKVDTKFDEQHRAGTLIIEDMWGNPFISWRTEPSEIVKLGRSNVNKSAFLIPSIFAATDVTCFARGHLFFSEENGNIITNQITFTYNDSAVGKRKVEEVKGRLTKRANYGRTILYDMRMEWSGTSPFEPSLKGAVTKNENSVSYVITGKNLSDAQFQNFVRWWMHCLVPSL